MTHTHMSSTQECGGERKEVAEAESTYRKTLRRMPAEEPPFSALSPSMYQRYFCWWLRSGGPESFAQGVG